MDTKTFTQKTMRFKTRILILHFSLFLLFTFFVYWGLKSQIAIFSMVAGFLFLYCMTTWALMHYVNKPLRKIFQYIKYYDDGNETTPPRIEGDGSNDAFDKLVNLLNSLSDRVLKQIQKLTTERNENESLLESLEEGVIALDDTGIITFANHKACSYLLKSKESLIGSNFDQIRSRSISLLQVCKNALKSCEKKKKEIRRHLVFGRKQKIYMDVIVSPHSFKKGYMMIFQDKTADYRVIDIGKDFVANASHELRTPIMIIQGYAEALQQMPSIPKDVLEEISLKIMRTSKRLSSIINNLLTLANIENYSSAKFVKCDVLALIEDCLHIIETLHNKVKITFEKPKKEIYIAADRGLMELAIVNILENAVKYSNDKFVIDVKLSRRAKKIKLSIKDQGIGIPIQDLEHIFDRFYRVDKARSRQAGGTGLGLSIVKTIIDKHQGKIDIDSVLGEGTCFTMHLPIYEKVSNSQNALSS